MAPKNEIDALYVYIKKLDQFYVKIEQILQEASYLDYKKGLIVSGLDSQISPDTWLNTFSADDLYTISGNLDGAKLLPTTLSGWRITYIRDFGG